MSLIMEPEPRETWTDVHALPTAFGRKAEACERCKAGPLLADGESLRQFSNRQRCKTAGCKRQDQRSAIVEAPVRHPSVLESSNAPTGNEGQVDQFARCAGSGCPGSGACACACPPPRTEQRSTGTA